MVTFVDVTAIVVVTTIVVATTMDMALLARVIRTGMTDHTATMTDHTANMTIITETDRTVCFMQDRDTKTRDINHIERTVHMYRDCVRDHLSCRK